MSELSRRSFVKSAGAAAGMTAVGSLVMVERAGAAPGTDPVVAYISDPSSGEINLMIGDREVTVQNRALAAQIAHAAAG